MEHSTSMRMWVSCNHSYLNILHPGNVYIQKSCKRALNNFCKRGFCTLYSGKISCELKMDSLTSCFSRRGHYRKGRGDNNQIFRIWAELQCHSIRWLIYSKSGKLSSAIIKWHRCRATRTGQPTSSQVWAVTVCINNTSNKCVNYTDEYSPSTIGFAPSLHLGVTHPGLGYSQVLHNIPITVPGFHNYVHQVTRLQTRMQDSQSAQYCG